MFFEVVCLFDITSDRICVDLFKDHAFRKPTILRNMDN